MRTLSRWPALILVLPALTACGGTPSEGVSPQASPETRTEGRADWSGDLAERVEAIDTAMPGEFGVYVKRLDGSGTVEHDADRAWYLASTVKVPVAIAILEDVEAGRRSLDDELELQQSDFVDGAGDLIWQEPGGRYTLATLIEKSLVDSDSTATDMLIRLVGEDTLNRRIRAWAGRGFGPVTTILQVRYDAYGELHPEVAGLSNMDLVALRNAESGQVRFNALARQLDVPPSELRLDSIEAAFERYYATGRNSATLDAFATLLEKLAAGELLSSEHTALVLGHMRGITTGQRRIQAGLPDGVGFAQKTGTQLARACNVGIVEPGGGRADLIVAACAKAYETPEQAEQAFQALGRALQESGALD